NALELFLVDQTLPFLNGEDPVRAHVSDFIYYSARPSDFDQVHLRAFFQTKMQSHVAMRDVARAASNFVNLSQVAGYNFYFRSDAVAIAFYSNGPDQD